MILKCGKKNFWWKNSTLGWFNSQSKLVSLHGDFLQKSSGEAVGIKLSLQRFSETLTGVSVWRLCITSPTFVNSKLKKCAVFSGTAKWGHSWLVFVLPCRNLWNLVRNQVCLFLRNLGLISMQDFQLALSLRLCTKQKRESFWLSFNIHSFRNIQSCTLAFDALPVLELTLGHLQFLQQFRCTYTLGVLLGQSLKLKKNNKTPDFDLFSTKTVFEQCMDLLCVCLQVK